MNLVIKAVAWLMLATHMLFAQQTISTVPDIVFYNGKIIAVDAAFTIAEAFAIRDDRIVAVGSNPQVRALAGPRTRLVDLREHAVIPGLMDNHNHQYHHGLMTMRGIDVQKVPSLAEMLNRIRQAAAAAPPGQTVHTTTGWNPNEFPEKRSPTRQELDEAAPDNPVVVYRSRSLGIVNSAALEALGITRDTDAVGVTVIEKDSSGEPSGVIRGSPASVLNLTANIVPPPTHEEKKELIRKGQQQQHTVGLTGIRELQIHPDVMRAYYDLWREGRLTMRVSMGLELNAGEEDRLEEMLAPWGVGAGFGDHWLRLDCIAEYNPGTLLREPFAEPGGNFYGESRIPEETFRQTILRINRLGWRPSIHAVGDKTLDWVLDAYEAADRENSIRDKRWIVEHIPLVHPDQMERMQRLGVMVSAQIQPYTGAKGMIRSYGKQRAERAVPMRELLDHGLIVSGGTDWPGRTNNPFLNIYFYVTRNTVDSGVLGAAQKISRQEALRVESLNNAYLTYEEKIKGSIEPGKLADFLILSHDILTVPEEQIRSILPLATYVGGRKVYSNPEGGF